MRRNSYESCQFEPLEGIKGSGLVDVPKGKERGGGWRALPVCGVLFIPQPELNTALQGGGCLGNTNDSTTAGKLKIRGHASLVFPELQRPRLRGGGGDHWDPCEFLKFFLLCIPPDTHTPVFCSLSRQGLGSVWNSRAWGSLGGSVG